MERKVLIAVNSCGDLKPCGTALSDLPVCCGGDSCRGNLRGAGSGPWEMNCSSSKLAQTLLTGIKRGHFKTTLSHHCTR